MIDNGRVEELLRHAATRARKGLGRQKAQSRRLPPRVERQMKKVGAKNAKVYRQRNVQRN